MDLPIVYKDLIRYSAPENTRDTNSKNRFIERILKQHNAKSVLDLTCGTGSQVFWLTKHGYNVTGVDISLGMLKGARTRARKEKLNMRLIHGDMRSTKVGSFDATITIFNAVGNITKADFKKTMHNVRQNLKIGGIYVFDILNKNCIRGPRGYDYESRWVVGDTEFHKVQKCRLNKKDGILSVYDRYYMQKGSNKPKVFRVQKWTMQIYTAKQLREMLVESGFDILNQIGLDGRRFSEKKTVSIVTIAKKR